jgi:hypothetical protein
MEMTGSDDKDSRIEVDVAVSGFSRKDAPDYQDPSDKRIKIYGTIDCGEATMDQAWPTLDWKWAVDSRKERIGPITHVEGPRYSLDLLNKSPVDMVVIERGHILRPMTSQANRDGPRWRRMISHTQPSRRPAVVLEVWDGKASLWPTGPLSKGERVKWDEEGYTSRYKEVSAAAVGGAVRQSRLLVVRLLKSEELTWP